MAYTLDPAAAGPKAPSRRTTQNFELGGNRGICHDGWMANTAPPTPVWLLATGALPDLYAGYQWELYHITEDFSQSNDLAAKNPHKLKEIDKLTFKLGPSQLAEADKKVIAERLALARD